MEEKPPPWLAMSHVLLAGCQSAPAGRTARAAAKPEFELESLDVVAFLGMAKSVEDHQMLQMVGPAIEDHLLATKTPFVLLPEQEVVNRMSREGAGPLCREVINFWRDSRKVDKLKTKELCAKLGAQAILVGDITDWMQNQALPDEDEPSYTRVSASLAIYSAETGRRVWRTRKTIYEKAQQLQGAAPSGRFTDTAGGSITGRKASEPPRYENVIPRLAETLAKTLAR